MRPSVFSRFRLGIALSLLAVLQCIPELAAVEESRPLLSPKEAVAKMTFPDGFSVDILAAEPALVQPIAFCWDEHGRIWGVEGNTYPLRAGNPPVPRPDDSPGLDQLTPEELQNLLGGKDRILIFSDEDGDGVYETRKVFMEGLNLVSGIEVGFGGVYVGAAPYFLHIPLSASGDKPAGPPRVLADGFGWQDTHETLNSFIWGPDGWLYGCHGVFTHSQVRVCTGEPRAQRPRIPMNCAYWRWHPIREEFELFAQGTSNPWGLDYNAKGQFFAEACVIPHFWHVIQGGYYLRQSNPLGHFNPYVYKNIETIADHAHFVGDSRSGARDGSGDTGGGHAHCGLSLYNGTLFPAEYRDRPFLGNIHGKRINQESLVPEGSGYRASHLPDFLKSNDHNFTAVTLKTGPDGALVFSDWYDKQKCHSRDNELWDRSNGRLYRLKYQGWKPWKETPGLWSAESTLELQLQENGWLSRMARRKAAEQGAVIRQNAALLGRATALLQQKDLPEDTALRVRWWLHGVGASYKLPANSGQGDYARFWDIQLNSEKFGSADPGELKTLAEAKASPVLRLAVASALQRVPTAARWDAVAALLGHAEDGDDHNLPQMAWFAIEPAVPESPARAVALAKRSQLSVPAELIARRLAETHTPEAYALLVRALNEAQSPKEALLFSAPFAEALKGRFQVTAPAEWSTAYPHLQNVAAKADSPEVASRLRDAGISLGAAFGDERAFPALSAVVREKANAVQRRQQALQTLVSAKAPGMEGLMLEMFDDALLRMEVLKLSVLLPIPAPGTPASSAQFNRTVIARYATLAPEEKTAAVLALSARASGARLLLEALAAKQIPRSDVSSFVARQIAALNDPDLLALLEKEWGAVRSSSADAMAKTAAEEHAKFKAILTPKFLKGADLVQGRQLFQGICGQCHQLFGEGGKIGPNLTGSNRADLDYILENVTNPSALIGKDYELHVFTLKDGRLVSGMVRQESEATITVQTLGSEEQVRRSDIAKEEKPGISMMPAGLFGGLSREQMRDLVGYLATPTQGGPAGAKKVEGALEGESLKVLNPGLRAVPQKMAHFRDGVWSGGAQLWWNGGKPGDVLKLAVPFAKGGRYRVKAVFSRAPDYGTVRFKLDGSSLGSSEVDLFGSKVTNTQELLLGEAKLEAGEHELSVEISGANPAARPAYMFGLDYLLLEAMQ